MTWSMLETLHLHSSWF